MSQKGSIVPAVTATHPTAKTIIGMTLITRRIESNIHMPSLRLMDPTNLVETLVSLLN